MPPTAGGVGRSAGAGPAAAGLGRVPEARVVAAPRRARLAGTRKILRFNWPLYACGAVACAAAVALARSSGPPAPVRSAGTVVAIAAAYLLVASTLVSWWVYDHSGLHRWAWLLPGLARVGGARTRADGARGGRAGVAGRWAACHAGFDEAGAALAGLLGPPVAVLDFGAGLPRRSGSLRRARQAFPPDRAARPAAPGSLPLEAGALDTVLLVFAAHEVRRREQRAALFRELARVVRPGGAVVLVEHPRALASLLAFGPGAWHFYPHGSWLALAGGAGFELAAELRQTPFVRGLVLCRR
jgi:SAM-dependent methyltransferase